MFKTKDYVCIFLFFLFSLRQVITSWNISDFYQRENQSYHAGSFTKGVLGINNYTSLIKLKSNLNQKSAFCGMYFSGDFFLDLVHRESKLHFCPKKQV